MSFGRKKPLDVSFSAVFYFCNMFSFFKKKEYKLTPIQELLLALLRAQLWLKPVDDIVLPSSLDEWEELINLGYKQTVICFIAKACLRHPDASNIPSDIKEEFEAVLEENKRIHEYHNSVLIELITKFEEQGLHPILLKGQGIAQMYPEPELRQCGDIDLFFVSEEYECAKQIIAAIEDENPIKRKDNSKHSEYVFKGITIEMHHKVCDIPNPTYDNQFQVWTQNCVNEKKELMIMHKFIYVNNPYFALIHCVTHILHHFETETVSLRQVCDLMMMEMFYREKIQLRKFDTLLKRYGLVRFWDVINTLMINNLEMTSYYVGTSHSTSAFLLLGRIMKLGAISFFQSDIKPGKGFMKYPMKLYNFYKYNIDFLRLYNICGMQLYWRHKMRVCKALRRNFRFLGRL